MSKFNLCIQHPKAGKPIAGLLDVDRHGQAMFVAYDGRVLRMTRTRLEYAAADGIMLSGVEDVGKGKLQLQEWWLIYPASVKR